MKRRKRSRHLSVRLNDLETAKLHALAETTGETVSTMLRRWTREAAARARITSARSAPPEAS